jgi:hypothetical protein
MAACHVCGSGVGVTKPTPNAEPTCPRDECMLAAAGTISVRQARGWLRRRGIEVRA